MPPHWLATDLGPEGPNPLFFQSISILLYTNASLIALQQSYTSLCSFLTWRPIVCAPVPCTHPCLFHPHADSQPSYRYPLASILIVYMSLKLCVPILYKQFSDFIVFPQFNYHKSLSLLNFILGILSFYLAHSMRSPTLEHSPTTRFITLSTDTSISDCLHPTLGFSLL